MKSPSSREATPNPEDGRFYIGASDWDENALLILLNVFHLRKRRIPREVSLEMLAKIAVLVDYYELEKVEAMEDHINDWADSVRQTHTVPRLYNRDLILWIFVSAILNMSPEFKGHGCSNPGVYRLNSDIRPCCSFTSHTYVDLNPEY